MGSIDFDIWVVVGLLILIAAVGALGWFKPETLRKEYEREIRELRDELHATTAKLQSLDAEYRKLATEYLRIVGENHWLRLQLRKMDIDIPPLPDDLRPHVDSHGNISIMVSGSGVQAGGGARLDVGGDVVGRDKREQQ